MKTRRLSGAGSEAGGWALAALGMVHYLRSTLIE